MKVNQKYWLLFVFLLGVFPSFAQDNGKIDSLVKLLQNAKDDTTKANALGELAIAYIYSNPDTAFTLAQKQFEIAKKMAASPDETFAKAGTKQMAHALNTQGVTFAIKGDYLKALKYYHKSLIITEELVDSPDEALAQSSKKTISMTCNNIGAIYFVLGDYPNALKYYHKTLLIDGEFENKFGISMTYNNIGIIYKEQGDYPNALKYYYKDLTIKKEIGDTSSGALANVCNNIGAIYFIQGDYPNALKYYHKSLKAREVLRDKNGIAGSYINIGNIYTKLDKKDKAVERLNKGLEIAKEIGALPIEKDAYSGLTELYEKQKGYENAYEYHRLYVQAKDSLFNEEKSKEIGKLEAKYEFEKKLAAQKRKAEADARIEDTRVKKRNLLQYSVIFIVLILMFILVFFIGKLPIGYRFAEFMVFMIFLLSFETVVVFLDTFIEEWTGGEPVYKLTLNALLAACIFPLHQLLEGLLKQRIVTSRKDKIRSNVLKVIVIGLLSVGNATDIFANNQVKIDSLKQALKTAKEDTNKAKILFKLSDEIYMTDPKKDLEYNKQALELVQKLGYKKGEATANKNIGIIYKNRGDYPNALKYYHKALKINEELGDKRGTAITYNNIGAIYYNQGDYPNALKYYHKALKIKEKLGDKRTIASTYNNIGAIYDNQGDYPIALKYYFKTLEIDEEFGDKRGIAMTYNNIGIIYDLQDDYPNALKYYHKALKIAEEPEDKRIMAKIYGNIGIIYKNQGDYPKALNYYHKSLKIKEELGDKEGLTTSYSNIGKLYTKTGDYVKALETLSKGLEIAKEIGALLKEKQAYGGLTDLYEKQKDYKNAYEYHQLYAQANDSLFNEEKSKEIGKLEAKYELEKKLEEEKHEAQEQATLVAEETARRNLFQYSGILVFIIALFTLALFAGKLRPPVWVAELLAFIPFLILFEGILVYIDPTIDTLTGGEPLWKLIVNAVLAGMIFPFHQYFEGKLKKRIKAKKN